MKKLIYLFLAISEIMGILVLFITLKRLFLKGTLIHC